MYTLTMLYEEIKETKAHIYNASNPDALELCVKHTFVPCAPEWLDLMENRLARDINEYISRGGKRNVLAGMGEVQTRIAQLREFLCVHAEWIHYA